MHRLHRRQHRGRPCRAPRADLRPLATLRRPAPVREHIRALRVAGIGVEQIALLAGLSTSHVRELADPRARWQPRHPAGPAPDRPPGLARSRRRGQSRTAQSCRRHGHSWPAAGLHRHRMAPRRAGRQARLKLRRTPTQHAQRRRHRANRPGRHHPLRTAVEPAPTTLHRRPERRPRGRPRLRRRTGWLPPLAWDDIDTDPEPQHHAWRVEKDDDLDEIAIERALAGDGVRLEHLTPAEQDEVVRRLSERGKSIRDIADQLATTKRTISRRRAAISAA